MVSKIGLAPLFKFYIVLRMLHFDFFYLLLEFHHLLPVCSAFCTSQAVLSLDGRQCLPSEVKLVFEFVHLELVLSLQ